MLDTHALLWLENRAALKGEAIFAIAQARAANKLAVSAISAWELGVALQKVNEERRPGLGGMQVDLWFRKAVEKLHARVLPISTAIALESARVPEVYGYGDPGDCFLIATARVRRLSLVTRDARIIALSKSEPGYLKVIEC